MDDECAGRKDINQYIKNMLLYILIIIMVVVVVVVVIFMHGTRY